MTDTLITLAAGLVLGFALGVGVGRSRRGALAENNHWVGETIEALKGADLDADVSRERALRLSGDTPAVDDPGIEVPGFMADSGYRPPAEPVVYEIETDGVFGRVCAYSVHCDEPVGGTVTWDTGKVEWLCAEHYTAFLADARHLGPCGWSNGDTVCGDPSAGTVTWPGQGPVDLCDTHLAWAREEVDG